MGIVASCISLASDFFYFIQKRYQDDDITFQRAVESRPHSVEYVTEKAIPYHDENTYIDVYKQSDKTVTNIDENMNHYYNDEDIDASLKDEQLPSEFVEMIVKFYKYFLLLTNIKCLILYFLENKMSNFFSFDIKTISLMLSIAIMSNAFISYSTSRKVLLHNAVCTNKNYNYLSALKLSRNLVPKNFCYSYESLGNKCNEFNDKIMSDSAEMGSCNARKKKKTEDRNEVSQNKNEDIKRHSNKLEDESNKLKAIQKFVSKKYPYLRDENLDTIKYRQNLEETTENNSNFNKNKLFYLNEIKSKPQGDYIEKILDEWWGEYESLELHHGYIQWLFPIRTEGMNEESQPLQLHELEFMRQSPVIKERLIKSFEMMLDFYGMKLLNKDTGEIGRASNYKERYQNLKIRRHNYLRITRILKCLGDMQLEKLQIGWLRFLIREVFATKALSPLDSSLANYWIHTIKDDNARNHLIDELEVTIYNSLKQTNSDDEDK